jgi:hypothetical protein
VEVPLENHHKCTKNTKKENMNQPIFLILLLLCALAKDINPHVVIVMLKQKVHGTVAGFQVGYPHFLEKARQHRIVLTANFAKEFHAGLSKKRLRPQAFSLAIPCGR